MDWTQVLTIVGSNILLAVMGLGTTITLFLWARSESREDITQVREEFREMRSEFREFRTIMLEETKSFHERLCQIEARRIAKETKK